MVITHPLGLGNITELLSATMNYVTLKNLQDTLNNK